MELILWVIEGVALNDFILSNKLKVVDVLFIHNAAAVIDVSVCTHICIGNMLFYPFVQKP